MVKIAVMTFRLRAAWVHSLKEKRMVVKSLIAKLQNKYHVSAAEVDEQDTHQIIVIVVAAIVPHNAMADSLMDDISLFVEENTDGLMSGDLSQRAASMCISPLTLRQRGKLAVDTESRSFMKLTVRRCQMTDIPFFESANHVWLTKEVPVRYLRKI